jgi:hypothetical protein
MMMMRASHIGDDVAPLEIRTAADVVVAFASFCKTNSPVVAAESIPAHEKLAVLGAVSVIDAWLGGLTVALSREPKAVR